MLSQAQQFVLAAGAIAAAAWWLLKDHLPQLWEVVQSLLKSAEKPAAAAKVVDGDTSLQAFLAIKDLIAIGTKTNNQAMVDAAKCAGRSMFDPPAGPQSPTPPAGA